MELQAAKKGNSKYCQIQLRGQAIAKEPWSGNVAREEVWLYSHSRNFMFVWRFLDFNRGWTGEGRDQNVGPLKPLDTDCCRFTASSRRGNSEHPGLPLLLFGMEFLRCLAAIASVYSQPIVRCIFGNQSAYGRRQSCKAQDTPLQISVVPDVLRCSQ